MGLKDNSELRNHFGSRAFSGDPHWDKMLGGPVKPNAPSALGGSGGDDGGQPPGRSDGNNNSSSIPSFRSDVYQPAIAPLRSAIPGHSQLSTRC